MNRQLWSSLYSGANSIRRLYWFVVRPKRNGVKVAIFDSNDRVLLVRHSYSRGWNLPGGGFNPRRETPEQAARREVIQELGLVLGDISVYGSYESTLEYKRDVIYCCGSTALTGEIRLSAEIAEACWFSNDALPERTSTAVTRTMTMRTPYEATSRN